MAGRISKFNGHLCHSDLPVISKACLAPLDLEYTLLSYQYEHVNNNLFGSAVAFFAHADLLILLQPVQHQNGREDV